MFLSRHRTPVEKAFNTRAAQLCQGTHDTCGVIERLVGADWAAGLLLPVLDAIERRLEEACEAALKMGSRGRAWPAPNLRIEMLECAEL